MKDFFEIGTFDRFIAGEFKNSPAFPAMIVAEEIALANSGADHNFLKNLFREFFKMPVNTPAQAVSAAVKAAQLCAGGFDQALKSFTAFFLKLNVGERIRFYAAADACAVSLDLKDPCDWVTLEALHDMAYWFPGEPSKKVSVTAPASPLSPAETFAISVGEVAEILWDRHLPTEMSFDDQVLYCVINMWLHPTDRRDYSCIGGDPDTDDTDWSKEPDLYKQLRHLKDAVTKRYNLELKAARK